MAHLQYSGVGILGMAAAVPRRIYDNLSDNQFFSPEEAREIVERTGIRERRIAPAEICSSDLCRAAAEKLLDEMGIARNDIDVLIVNTQTPDYKTPGTSNVLHNWLGLKKACAAYDTNLGGSGFVYGLSLALALASQPDIKYVLLLTGETGSKVFSDKDKEAGLVFGDAGSACIVGKSDPSDTAYFKFLAEGANSGSFHIPAGGLQRPSSPDTIREQVRPDGSLKSDEHGSVDFGKYTESVLANVPGLVSEIVGIAGETAENVGWLAPHQSVKAIMDVIGAGSGFSPEQVLTSYECFGDTGSASIPLSICLNEKKLSAGRQWLVIAGFGSGLSYAVALVALAGSSVHGIVEV